MLTGGLKIKKKYDTLFLSIKNEHGENMSASDNLRLLRRIRGLTLEELSAQVGISVSYLSRIESGNRRVTGPLLMKLSEALQCDPSEVMADTPPDKQISMLGFSSLSMPGSGGKTSDLTSLLAKVAAQLDSSSSSSRIPVFTTQYFNGAASQPTGEAPEDAEELLEGVPLKDPSDWLVAPPELLQVKNAFGYCIANEEMSPRYVPGDIVFVNPQKPLVPGCSAVIVKNDGSTYLRRFMSTDGKSFNVQSLRPEQTETFQIDDLKGVYRIVATREFA